MVNCLSECTSHLGEYAANLGLTRRNVLIFQVRREIVLEVEAGVSEMCFNRDFRAVQVGSNLFYWQVLGIVEEKYLSTCLCEMKVKKNEMWTK